LRESQRNGFGSGQRLSKARLSGWLGCCEGLDHAEGIGLDTGKGLDPVKWSHLPEGKGLVPGFGSHSFAWEG
jgi:hypothetical protein